MNRPRPRSASAVVRRIAIPADLPVGVEATAAELARVSNERARLLRELTALETRRHATRDRLTRIERRLRELVRHLDTNIGEADPAQAGTVAPAAPPVASPRPSRLAAAPSRPARA